MRPSGVDRRGLLRASLGLAAVAGTTAVLGTGTASAVAAAPPADPLPEVPGMLGDRLANEFWYRFDQCTAYAISAELAEAYAVLRSLFDRFERDIYFAWRDTSSAGTYPAAFAEFVTPIKPQLEVISRAQLIAFDELYRRRDPRLVTAFTTFGEGVLFDPRLAPMQQEVHTMNGKPPVGYHTWHAFIRAMMLLGIDAQRWREIASLNALAWAVQTVAKPDTRVVSPPLPRPTVRRLTRLWLPKSSSQLDTDFLSFPYPAGMS
ncbi:hypothetical protein DMB66_26380 [Actinoplanes sp. ATCC 53533]|uniref:hypothetical protein n=1 Tax=Actinoplanes sp. ATCC 53533 TaxID=1288362 RepID=UPI000F7B191E|nr:hypothetical protein [Actinoplanes sp. ATCC 53533]RSM59782.1 hypothetical protein DMB66_26380 [Actinoplanes sp. ATCC 53533]